MLLAVEAYYIAVFFKYPLFYSLSRFVARIYSFCTIKLSYYNQYKSNVSGVIVSLRYSGSGIY